MNSDWIAGFFDGEGSVSLLVRQTPDCVFGYQFRPSLQIAQKNEKVIRDVQKALGYGQVYPHAHGMWYWQAYRHRDLQNFVAMFYRRCIVKQLHLTLLRRALPLLSPKPGDCKPMSKSHVLRLVRITEQLRRLNGNQHKTRVRLDEVRSAVAGFDPRGHEEKLRLAQEKRIEGAQRLAVRRHKAAGLTPKRLRDLRWSKHLSSRQIAEISGYSATQILRLMVKWGIPRF